MGISSVSAYDEKKNFGTFGPYARIEEFKRLKVNQIGIDRLIVINKICGKSIGNDLFEPTINRFCTDCRITFKDTRLFW